MSAEEKAYLQSQIWCGWDAGFPPVRVIYSAVFQQLF